MTKTSYTACATRPEDIVVCTALDTGNYPERYSERVSEILGNIKDESLRKTVKTTLGTFESESDGKLAQSSPYRLVALQQLLPKGNVLVARSRLQIAKQNNPDFMSGFYVDCGLNLVSGGEYRVNPFLAEKLAGDLKKVGIDLKDAKLIPYNVLTLQADTNSPSGLVFKLSEEGKDRAKDLILNTSDFKWDCSPSSNGLFRAYLDRYGYWDSYGVGLADSSGNGRVVVEKTGEASRADFDALTKEAQSLLERQKQERENLVRKLSA